MTTAVDLRAEINRFRADLPISEARTPPASWYVDPAFYALEQRSVFSRNWCAAARSEQVARPGQFVCGDLAGEPYVITRDREGRLRAFFNVCSHHAAQVATGESGVCEELVCPYHAWTYELNGRLKRAPEVGGVQGFDRDAMGLKPIAVREWCGLVFLCLEETRSMDEDFGKLAAQLEATNMSSLKFVERRTWHFKCNWKIFVDNYLDGGYHIAHLHHGLASELDLKSYSTDVFDRYSVQQVRSSQKNERIGEDAIYVWMYPNFMINRYGRWLDTNWVRPLTQDATLVHIDYYVDDPADPFVAQQLETSGSVQDEDVDICESVQRGLASRAYDQGIYSVSREPAAFAFHRLLATDLASELE